MAKRVVTYLEEGPIQDLERMSEEDMQRIPVSQLIDLLRKLLRSYRIAATVANAAWKFWDTLTNPKTLFSPPDAEAELQGALSGYSPENFSPDALLAQRMVDELEYIYANSNGDLQQAMSERWEYWAARRS